MTTPDWMTKFFERAISVTTATPIFLATLFITIIPDSWAIRIGMDIVRREYALWVGFGLLISGATLLASTLGFVAKQLQPLIRDQLFIYSNRHLLHQLLEEEKAILRQFIADGCTGVYYPLYNPTIGLLENKRVVSRTSNVSAPGGAFPFVLQPWAREYLEKHPELLNPT